MLPFGRMIKYANIAPAPKTVFKYRLQCSADAKFYLNKNGDLYWCGSSSYGQGGNGSTESSTEWTLVNTNVIRYWGGVQGTLVIKDDDTIWYTGTRVVIPHLPSNTGGNWIDITHFFTDFGVTASDIDSVVISACMRVFLKNGKWFFCGAGTGGVFGNGESSIVSTFTYSHIENVRSAGCSIRSTGLVLQDGTYWYAGATFISGSTTTNVLSFKQDTSITSATQAVNTIETSYIFLNDGTVKVASTNGSGQAGVGNTSRVPMSTVIPNLSLQGEVNVVGELGTNLAGPSCIIQNNNKLLTCGINANGQCGVGSNETYITQFTEINLSALEGRSLNGFCRSYNYILLIDEDDNLYVCGDANFPDVVSSNIPIKIPTSLLPWKK